MTISIVTHSTRASEGPVRQELPDLVRHYWRADKPWSGSYFPGSADGARLPTVRQYIEQRNRPL
ncbi:transposase [Streptomyces sp. NPDC004787]|uniref:transposase n=1 Tax=Streptomyces sp. NPDC004787 TaxID=3154291 RepID=UPI0033B7DC77